MLTEPLSVSGDRAAPSSVGRVRHASMIPPDISAAPAGVDPDSHLWLTRLRGMGPDRDAAITELHALLLRAARFEVARRHSGSAHLRGGDQDDLAQQSADDALVAILGKLGDFRGDSRFSTWAYKFALYEAAAKVRKRAWQRREIPLHAETWPLIADDRQLTPQRGAEIAELLVAVQQGIEHDLSPHQREVLVTIALNDVPIDVLAERLNTTRGAIYKTVHDARQKLRAALEARGLSLDETRTAS
jgi:RNA polymerase sigma-70 factor (ECF subfamily)